MNRNWILSTVITGAAIGLILGCAPTPPTLPMAYNTHIVPTMNQTLVVNQYTGVGLYPYNPHPVGQPFTPYYGIYNNGGINIHSPVW